MVEIRPYIDIEIEDNCVIREFDENIDPIELMWHRDLEDRLVQSIGFTDWKIQLENQLPKLLNNKILIKKYVWHRVIKGTGSLKIKIIKSV